MITRKELILSQKRAARMLKNAGVAITKEEISKMEVADFGLSDLKNIGLQIIVYVNNERYCAKELILFPRQICPEHRHPPVGNDPGKQETFRCRWGTVYLYTVGKKVAKPKAKLPKRKEKYFTVWHEIILKPGQQYTIPPNTLHWFQAGPKGAIISEFSSTSRDEFDIFTDPEIKRQTVIKG